MAWTSGSAKEPHHPALHSSPSHSNTLLFSKHMTHFTVSLLTSLKQSKYTGLYVAWSPLLLPDVQLGMNTSSTRSINTRLQRVENTSILYKKGLRLLPEFSPLINSRMNRALSTHPSLCYFASLAQYFHVLNVFWKPRNPALTSGRQKAVHQPNITHDHRFTNL